MNTASQDLPHHLGVLRERMLHPTDYDLALNYFLEEFAGDVKFLDASEPDDAPHLLAVLAHVAERRWAKRRRWMKRNCFCCASTAFITATRRWTGACCCFSISRKRTRASRR